MTSVAWKQSYSRFSEQLDFFQLENSIKFVLSKFYLLCFVSMAFSRLPYILVHDFFPIGIFERSHCSTATAIRLELMNIPKGMVWRSFVASESSHILKRFTGDTGQSE